MASSTALCSSGPIELSLSQSTSPFSSCKETACARAGSTAARTFWHTASKSTSGLSITFKGLPCSIDHSCEISLHMYRSSYGSGVMVFAKRPRNPLPGGPAKNGLRRRGITYDGDSRASNRLEGTHVSSANPSISLLRFCDGRLCLRAALLKFDWARQGNFDPHSRHFAHADLPGGRAVFPDLLYFRRHPHRGLRLRPRSSRRVGGIRGTRVRIADGRCRRAPASIRPLARDASSSGRDIRQHAAHRARLDHCISVRHIRQQLRARQDEDLDQRPLALDAYRRLDVVRRARGFG